MFNIETKVKIEEINSGKSFPASVVMSGFHQEEIRKELSDANLQEELLLQGRVKQENSCSKLLPYQIKLDHPNMKHEITEDNYDIIELQNFIAEEEYINGTTSEIELIEMKKGFLDSNISDKFLLEDVGKQDSCGKSLHIKLESEMIDSKYESIKEVDAVDIKLEELAHEELIIKDEVIETVHSKEKPFNCDVCNYKFIKKSNLQRHMKIHTGEKRFNCNLCDYKCMDNSRLRKHMMIHTGERPFNCNECSYKCATKINLQTHMKIHTGERPFICNICDSKFIHKNGLEMHMKIHTGEKPYKCNECDYKCIRKSDLQKHIKIHTGEKPFICNVCDSKFALKSHLRVHTMIHIGEKPWNCNFCDYKCIGKSTLRSHMRMHTGEKTFNCYVCDSKYIRKSSLVRHMKIHITEESFT